MIALLRDYRHSIRIDFLLIGSFLEKTLGIIPSLLTIPFFHNFKMKFKDH